MAVGIIKTCKECGESWDSGRVSFHICNPINIAKKKERDRWPEMDINEKLEYLKIRINEVENNIPRNGRIF